MAKATFTITGGSPLDEVVHTEVAIVGGGICGIMAAKRCSDRQWPFMLVERNEELGGVWSTLANPHSYLQAYEMSYRWDEDYRLSKDKFSKNSGIAVRHNLRQYAYDHSIDHFTLCATEVITIRHQKDGSFMTVCKNLKTGKTTGIQSAFVMVTPGILGRQYTAADRGVMHVDRYRGILTYGGRMDGVPSAVGSTNLTGKNVVIMGTGAFALEAMEAAARNNAKHITLVSRPRQRWVLPFSRQQCFLALAFLPLVPWTIKMRLAGWYLRTFFYKAVGLGFYPPGGNLVEQDWGGQCNDGLFRLAHENKLTVEVDRVSRLEEHSVVLESGKKLPADMFVCAAGCHYNDAPKFLAELGVETASMPPIPPSPCFRNMHNFCFLGNNPRLGMVTDFVFGFVPAGPEKQLEMFFHSAEQIKAGNEEGVMKAMIPTPLNFEGKPVHPEDATAVKFFEYRHWYSTLNIATEERAAAYLAIMDVGKSPPSRLAARLRMVAGGFYLSAAYMFGGLQELWRCRVFGKGVTDHYHPKPPLFQAPKRKDE